MARSAVVRSASLAPHEAILVDRLASQLAGGSFTELTRLWLRWFGEPVSRRLAELAEAGIDPHERLAFVKEGPISAEEDLADFYRAANPWPEDGPQDPPLT